MKIIVIEGENAIGKTTQIRFIHELLLEKGIKVWNRRVGDFNSMYNVFLNDYIETGALKGRLTHDAMAIMFLSQIRDFMQNMQSEIKKQEESIADLKKTSKRNKRNIPQVLLLDRYIYSHIAFQGASCNKFYKEAIKDCKHYSKEDIEEYLEIKSQEFYNDCRLRIETTQLPAPDLALYLDVPTEFRDTMIKRLKTQNKDLLDVHEREGGDFLNEVKSGYLRMCDEGFYNLKRVEIDDAYASEGTTSSHKMYENLRKEVQAFIENKLLDKELF